MRKVVQPAYMDPHNSVDLFDADRQNAWGDMFCVAPAILRREVEEYWQRYVKEQAAKTA
jgi:hypothetical protein